MTPSPIDGVVLMPLVPHGDERGFFVETFRKEWFPGRPEMLQTNLSTKRRGAVVGIHFHLHQADYWYLVEGIARVGLFDLRQGSPTEGKSWSFDMGAADPTGLYIPPGVGHGFGSLTDVTMLYQVDGYYNATDELGVAWDDPALGIDWGIANPVISNRDMNNPTLEGLDRVCRPVYANPTESSTKASMNASSRHTS